MKLFGKKLPGTCYEVVSISIIAVCILASVAGFLMAQVPVVKGFLGFKDQKVINTSVTEPVWLEGPNHVKYLATKETVLDETKQISQSFVTKLEGWIIVLAILCFVFPGLGVWLLAKSKAATAQIVHGVELAKKEMTPANIKILETQLSSKADQTTKDLVKSIKSELVKSGDISTTVIQAQPVPVVTTTSTTIGGV